MDWLHPGHYPICFLGVILALRYHLNGVTYQDYQADKDSACCSRANSKLKFESAAGNVATYSSPLALVPVTTFIKKVKK